MGGGGDGFEKMTRGMMESGYDNVFPMRGDGSYRCPRCGRTGTRDDFGAGEGGKGARRCPECGREIPY